MSDTATPSRAAGERVRAAIALADRRRRTREATRMFWRAAPALAAFALGMAVVARWAGWPATVPIGVLIVCVAGIAAYAVQIRRGHLVSDAVAADIDRTAGLQGELRSANWFAVRTACDAWADLHLDRAAERLEAMDWVTLYPIPRQHRAKLATAVMLLGTLALTNVFPPRGGVLTETSARTPADVAGSGEIARLDTLPPELRKQLEDLLAAAAAGTLAVDSTKSAGLRDFLERLTRVHNREALEQLARALDEGHENTSTVDETKTLAERARRAAEMPSVAPEMRNALAKLADQLELVESDRASRADASGRTSSRNPRQENAARNSGEAGMDEASIVSVQESEGATGAGVVMMADENSPTGAPPGFGVGGSGSGTSAARLTQIEQALRQETVEANADSPGTNVAKDARRETEQGRATQTFTRSGSGRFDRGHPAATPPVPETRRSGVRSYFIRKPASN